MFNLRLVERFRLDCSGYPCLTTRLQQLSPPWSRGSRNKAGFSRRSSELDKIIAKSKISSKNFKKKHSTKL